MRLRVLTAAIVVLIACGATAPGADAALFYGGHVTGPERAKIGLVVTPKNRHTRRVHYVITGAIRVHCDRGTSKQRFRFDPGFGDGMVVNPPLHRFGVIFIEALGGRKQVTTRFEGRMTRHRAHGRIRIKTRHDHGHGKCDSGKRRWQATRD